MAFVLGCIVAAAMLAVIWGLVTLHRLSDAAEDAPPPDPVVTIRGEWFKLAPADILAVTFLHRLAGEIDAAAWSYLDHRNAGPRVRLMRLRGEFRKIIAARPVAGLMHVLQTDRPAVQQVAVWLIGRCCNSSVAPAILAWTRGKKRPLRKEGVRALRRLGAKDAICWFEKDGDPAIGRMAGARPPRPFVQRLAQYRGVEPTALLHATPGPASQMEFFSRVPLFQRSPPKPVDYIRRILERIRRLLRGTPGTGNRG